jgi:hypothetical protein
MSLTITEQQLTHILNGKATEINFYQQKIEELEKERDNFKQLNDFNVKEHNITFRNYESCRQQLSRAEELLGERNHEFAKLEKQNEKNINDYVILFNKCIKLQAKLKARLKKKVR